MVKISCGNLAVYFILSAISILFILLYSISASPLYVVDAGSDTNIFNVIGIGITQGKLPYKDLFDHKGPLLFYIFALAHYISSQKWGIFIIEFIFLFVSLSIQYRISLLFLNYKKSLLVVAFSLIFVAFGMGDGGPCEFFELPFIYIGLWQIIKCLKTKQAISYFKLGTIEGFCFGAVFLIRINDAFSPIGIGCFGLACFLIYKKSFKQIGLATCGFIISFLLMLLPFVVYFLYKGIMNDVWYGMYTFNFKYMGYIPAQNYILKLLVLSFLLVSSFLTLKKKHDNNLTYFIILPTIISSIFFIGPNAYEHYYMVLTPIFGVLVCLIFNRYYLGLTAWILIFGGWNVGNSTIMNSSLYQTAFWHCYIYKGNLSYKSVLADFEKMAAVIPDSERNEVWNYNVNTTFYMNFYTHNKITPCNKYFVPFHKNFDRSIPLQENVFVQLPKWITVIENAEFKSNIDKFNNKYETIASTHFENDTISLLKLKLN